MRNDCKITIATARRRTAKRWKNEQTTWGELLERCSKSIETRETASEYEAMSRDEQSDIKDVGGFVGGYLQDGVRKTANVVRRSVATLDIDYGTDSTWEDFEENFNFGALMYGTHKHNAAKGQYRYRLVFPLSRDVTPEEYEPLCRKIASVIGIEQFDVTTYQLARLFYWPSHSKGQTPFFRCQDGPACDVDAILGEYVDWHDASCWPVSVREGEVVAHEVRKVGDPFEKPGLIGAFCRTYSIEEAIDAFLSDRYAPVSGIEHRYTYVLGSTSGGLVCYEGKFAYSNHESDPVGCQLCNSFDLVRIHLFGDRDEGCTATKLTNLPSYKAMTDFAAKDKAVCMTLARERLDESEADFSDVGFDASDPNCASGSSTSTTSVGDSWLGSLDTDKNGKIRNTRPNIALILEHDEHLRDKLWFNDLDKFIYIRGKLPWGGQDKWGNNDPGALRTYIERRYGVDATTKTDDAMASVLFKHTYHPIRDYLNGLTWDGHDRLDTLLVDYLGAEDTPLTRAVTRKHFTAAVARVFEPGCKYDYILMIVGGQGIGKSSLMRVMGGDWFSDSLKTFDGGKTCIEQLRTGWLHEIAELDGMRRSEVTQVKAFISCQTDRYRPAYGRVVESVPRQCVFCGTTNERYFLKDVTGNRRFWVVAVDGNRRQYDSVASAMEALALVRDQLWAEALHRYKSGEPLYLDDRMEQASSKVQETYDDNADDPLIEMVGHYLATRLPVDWDTWDIDRRRAFYKQPDPLAADASEERTRACATGFQREMLCKDIPDRYITRRVNDIIKATDGWHDRVLRVEPYGVVRGFEKDGKI